MFFLSYAHGNQQFLESGYEADRYVLELYKELSGNVAELVGRLPGWSPGFMDRSMDGSQRWTPELLRAAATCQVFVPLISPSLLTSRWCAMEWDLFSRRRIDSGDGRTETAILPVAWAPTDFASLPRVVREVQFFSPLPLPDLDYAAQYQQEGVVGLHKLSLHTTYRAVVWRLAQRIVAISRAHRVEPLDDLPEPAELRDVFREEGA
ncbi:TIR-like protein FxsC [Phytohabitans kaempferiae]|uniref:TIR-like protein FxsC n=1 Tax=Phytohabitans kaempferiae TaxID=1620943 RepID=A0ABV6MEH0_9ACTN